MGWVESALIAIALVEVLLAVAVLALAREVAVILARLGPVSARELPAGPAVGEDVGVRLRVTDLAGKQHAFATTAEHRGVLLLFTRNGCRACKEVLEYIPHFAKGYRKEFDVWILNDGRINSWESPWQDVVRVGALVSEDDTLRKEFWINVTPFAINVSPEGTVVSKGVVNSLAQIEALTGQIEVEVAAARPGHVHARAEADAT